MYSISISTAAFYAISVGKISIVAPIITAHPAIIVGFQASQGTHPSILQIAVVAGILPGVALVGLAGNSHAPANSRSWILGFWGPWKTYFTLVFEHPFPIASNKAFGFFSQRLREQFI